MRIRKIHSMPGSPGKTDVKPPASGGTNRREHLTVGSDPPTACCFSYTLRQLPRNFVTDYFETSSLCSQPAVVFQTKRGRQVCANPSEPWVQEYMNDLELN
ncbi:hypothetical protein GH733_014046 [Mirounga leonina]|nr:hypothetical protein GH733_014046 [Mirounga leonina]